MLIGVLMYSSCTSELSSNENVKDDVSLETRSMVGCDSENVPPAIFIEEIIFLTDGVCCIRISFDPKFDGSFFRIHEDENDPSTPLTSVYTHKGVIKNGTGYESGSTNEWFCVQSGMMFAIEVYGADHPYAIACNSFTVNC